VVVDYVVDSFGDYVGPVDLVGKDVRATHLVDRMRKKSIVYLRIGSWSFRY